MSSPPDPFEFMKSLWGSMGLPLAGLGAPNSAMSEIDRRIAELKSVETWLNMNLSVLRMTIQGLEMQKAGLAAMQSATMSPASETPQPHPGGGDPEKK
jgi:hypothetical protein